MTDIRTPIGNLRPYHVYPLIVYLRDHHRELDDETRRKLMEHVAMHCPDPAAAAALADIHGDKWGTLYPREDTATPGTTATIDKFIATYGHASAEEDALLERLILNPTPDYGAVLADEDEAGRDDAAAPADATAAGIDGFLAAHGAGGEIRPAETPLQKSEETVIPEEQAEAAEDGAAEETAENTAENMAEGVAEIPTGDDSPKDTPAMPKKNAKDQQPSSSLSESLAKIYIRQGRYRRAYEILSDLNLKNPEKSIYFADQLRFLRKVISLMPPGQEGESRE